MFYSRNIIITFKMQKKPKILEWNVISQIYFNKMCNNSEGIYAVKIFNKFNTEVFSWTKLIL